jgi:hypothetical protein
LHRRGREFNDAQLSVQTCTLRIKQSHSFDTSRGIAIPA